MASSNAKWLVTTQVSLEFNDAWALMEEKVLHTGADPKPLLDQLQADFETKLADALK